MPGRISIHAPARGATYCSLLHKTPKKDFNPRSREGSDKIISKVVFVCVQFQSTLPRGERLIQLVTDSYNKGISIHAPARGATISPTPLSICCFRFQSTLPRGERPRLINMLADKIKISIHAPARGATAVY